MLATHTTIDNPNKLESRNRFAVLLTLTPPASDSWTLDIDPDDPNPHVVIAYNESENTRELMFFNRTSRSVRIISIYLREDNFVRSFILESKSNDFIVLTPNSVVLTFVEVSII